ncbi:MAG: hypothetical protein ACRENG_31895 [bacterium]
MPGLQYWFSGTALFLPVSFAITVVIGLVGIKDMISGKWIISLMVLSFIVTLIAWYTAAKQEKESAELGASIKRIADYVNINSNQSAQALADEILKKFPAADWHLTEEERQKLGIELDAISEHDRFQINIQALIGSTQSQMYKDDLAIVIHDHHWSVSGGVDLGLRPDLIGLFVAFSPEVKNDQEIPLNAITLANILKRSGIDFAFGRREGLAKDAFQLNIGARPPK